MKEMSKSRSYRRKSRLIFRKRKSKLTSKKRNYNLKKIKGKGIKEIIAKGGLTAILSTFFSTTGIPITTMYAGIQPILKISLPPIIILTKNVEDGMRNINEKLKELEIPKIKNTFDSINNLILNFKISDSIDCNFIKIPKEIIEYNKYIQKFLDFDGLFKLVKIFFNQIKDLINKYFDKILNFLEHNFFDNFDLDKLSKNDIKIFLLTTLDFGPKTTANVKLETVGQTIYNTAIDPSLVYSTVSKPLLKAFIDKYKSNLKDIKNIKDKLKLFIIDLKDKIKSLDINKYKSEIDNIKSLINDIINFKCERGKKIMLKDNELLRKIQSNLEKIKEPFNKIKSIVDFFYNMYEVLIVIFHENIVKFITFLRKMEEFIQSNTILANPITQYELAGIIVSPTTN